MEQELGDVIYLAGSQWLWLRGLFLFDISIVIVFHKRNVKS